MMRNLLVCAALAAGLGIGAPAQAQGVKIGALSCHEEAGWGFVFGSSRALRCTFTGEGGRIEHYHGSINRFGVDIGYQQSGVLLWAVIAPNDHPSRGALAGHYGGATAGATVGVGLGANVLVGGFDRSIALQPLSIEGASGLNVAAGIGEMTLEAHSGD